MPNSFMSLFPHVLNALETMKVPMQTSIDITEIAKRFISLSFNLMQIYHNFNYSVSEILSGKIFMPSEKAYPLLLETYWKGTDNVLVIFKENLLESLSRFQQERLGELEFLNLFTEEIAFQDWTVEYDDTKILLDLPSLRVIDISVKTKHKIQNYAVIFAPRAGHHSNIAERIALYMRNQGLTRMAIVEQKCAEDIPLCVEGKMHDEGFDGQVAQYRKVLEHLNGMTGFPPHLIAICQPGPLLMSTLILYPHLGKTFGSAGAPMHTEAEQGYLTDFARTLGDNGIDKLFTLFGRTITEARIGAGREIYDGRFQVLGFYYLGMNQHYRNLKKLLDDLKRGDEEASERQKVFYRWYNYVHHFPAEFIRDTYKKIFVNNELIRGKLTIGGKEIGIKDYPASVPIWALGGTKDDIAPPLQAVGHMDLIDSVPPEDKLTLLCEGGHMGLFRSTKILEEFYTRVAGFILDRSDKIEM